MVLVDAEITEPIHSTSIRVRPGTHHVTMGPDSQGRARQHQRRATHRDVPTGQEPPVHSGLDRRIDAWCPGVVCSIGHLTRGGILIALRILVAATLISMCGVPTIANGAVHSNSSALAKLRRGHSTNKGVSEMSAIVMAWAFPNHHRQAKMRPG
jgi:hypothetical protein